MKQQIIYLLCIALGITSSINAQQTDEKASRELYQDYVDQINLNDLTTPFILNRGFINNDEITTLYQFIEAYDEETNDIVAPVSQMDGVSWLKLYNYVLESEIQTSNKLPTIDVLNNTLEDNTTALTNVPILIFDVKGEMLEDTEIEKSIQNLPKDAPYNTVHLFGAVSYLNTFYGKNINFELTLDNYFSGFNSKESEIFIDFSDGRGIQPYNTSQGRISVKYSSYGEKQITVYRNATLNGTSMKIGSSFVIDLKSKPELAGKSTSGNGFSSTISNTGAVAHVDLSPDNVFDKPVIIVQGFDPIGSISVDTQVNKYQSFNARLKNNGFDIVYVMLKNTQLALQNNTNYLKDLIKKINTQKQGNFESVIIGESMGGLLSRMALKQLENENYDHKIGLYVSFDAPHQGANLPPGIQHLFKDVMDTRTIKIANAILSVIDDVAIGIANVMISPFTGSRIPELRDVFKINMAYDALAALNSPAAKSMLVRHISKSNYFNSTQNTLQNLGYPSLSRNIALINGSNESIDLQRNLDGSVFTPGDILIHFPLWKSECNEFSLNAWSSPTNRTNAQVSQILWKIGLKVPDVRVKWEVKCVLRVLGKCILKTKLPVKLTVGMKCASTNIKNERGYFNFDAASYDNAPGSVLPSLDNLPINIYANTSFVPTASAIDLSENGYNSSTHPKGLTAITNSSVLDNFIRNNHTPFDEVYSKQSNSSHVFFTGGDFTNFDTIIGDELMPNDLELQNKTINYDRDFEGDLITIGNNVNTRASKIFDTGNVVVQNNADVNFVAKDRIVFYSGFQVKSGASIVAKISNTSAKTRVLEPLLEDDFQIAIIGSKTYNTGTYPAFKVLTSKLDVTYDYHWELAQNKGITSRNDQFIINDILYPGTYSIKVDVTSNKTFKTKTITKTFRIKGDLDKAKKEVFNTSKTRSTIQVYPNPVVNDVTIIGQKEISKITVYNLSSQRVLEINNIRKSWETIDLTKLSTGTYVVDVHFVDQSSAIRKKIIKK